MKPYDDLKAENERLKKECGDANIWREAAELERNKLKAEHRQFRILAEKYRAMLELVLDLAEVETEHDLEEFKKARQLLEQKNTGVGGSFIPRSQKNKEFKP